MISVNTNERLDGKSNLLLPQEDWDDDELMNIYAMVSANLTNFLPVLDFKEHKSFYQKYRCQQLLNGEDIRLFEAEYPLPIVGWESLRDKLKSSNGIIATFHFGPFQLINYLLIRSEIPYVLLVAGQVKDEWEIRYPELLKYLTEAEEKGRFILLDANDGSALRKLYRYLKKDFKLLIYIDGIEGLNKHNSSKMANVNLLGQNVCIPKGTATLAHYFRLPIFPCLLLRHTDSISVELDYTIFPDATWSLETFIQVAYNRIFTFLGKYIMHWPEQWTNWSMLHRLLLHGLPIGADHENKAELDQQYTLIKLDKTPYLMEKRTYHLFPLSTDDYNALKSSWF